MNRISFLQEEENSCRRGGWMPDVAVGGPIFNDNEVASGPDSFIGPDSFARRRRAVVSISRRRS